MKIAVPLTCLSHVSILAILSESRQGHHLHVAVELEDCSKDTLQALQKDLEDSVGEDIPGLLEQLQKELDSRN